MLLLAIADATQAVQDLTSFGAAGFMGAMWLWERRSNRQREDQLDQAHARIMEDKIRLETLLDTIRENTEAISRLSTLIGSGRDKS